MGFSSFDERESILAQLTIHDTDGTGYILAVSPTRGATRIDTWSLMTTDAVAREFEVSIQNPSGVYQENFRFTVPPLAGTGGHVNFDVLAAVLPATNQGLVLPPGQAMQVKAVVALSAGAAAWLTLIGGVI